VLLWRQSLAASLLHASAISFDITIAKIRQSFGYAFLSLIA
jgi:hypothetical protein